MKKLLLVGALLVGATVVYGAKYQDGTYRGFYESDVAIEFKLENDIITDVKYRGLSYGGTNFAKDEAVKSIKDQYDALLTYAKGKNVDTAMKAMYAPGEIQNAGATIRATKVRAAIKNGLIHDAYSIPKAK